MKLFSKGQIRDMKCIKGIHHHKKDITFSEMKIIRLKVIWNLFFSLNFQSFVDLMEIIKMKKMRVKKLMDKKCSSF
jgi:hypothetical protein